MSDESLLRIAEVVGSLKGELGKLVGKTDAIIKLQGIKGDQGGLGVQGDKGPKGDKGDKGDRGHQGDTGPKGGDGFQGAPGVNGADGKDGEDGNDGVSVTDAYVALDGNLVIVLSDGREVDVGEVVQHTDAKGDVYVSGRDWQILVSATAPIDPAVDQLWCDTSTDILYGYGNRISTKTGNYTITSEDYTILCDTTSGAIVVSLLAASSVSGHIYNIKKIDAGANSVTISANGSNTIDGNATKVITTPFVSITIQSNGTNWYIL